MSILATLKDILWNSDDIDDSNVDFSLSKEDKENLSAEDISALEKCLKNVNDAALKCGQPSEDKLKKFKEEAKRFSQENEEIKDKNNKNDKNNEKDNEPIDKSLEDKER